jgi:hypothetical protein
MRTNFFATTADIEKVIEAIEADGAVKYVRAGMFDAAEIEEYRTGMALPHLGVALNGDPNHEAYYLVTPSEYEVLVRPVPQRRGGTKYAIDQALNAPTIIFWPCGSYKDEAIIGGQVSTASATAEAKELYRRFRGVIGQVFVKNRDDYIGREAMKRARDGVRLTGSVRSPRIYDVQLTPEM